jgi:hypothetical protein
MAYVSNTLNWPANSASSGFQHESNSVVSSIHNEPSETRSIRSDNQSTFHATYTFDKRSKSERESSRLSNFSSVDSPYSGPICLTDDANLTTDGFYTEDYGFNILNNPKYIFTPYVSIFYDIEQELEKQKQNQNDSTSSLFPANWTPISSRTSGRMNAHSAGGLRYITSKITSTMNILD